MLPPGDSLFCVATMTTNFRSTFTSNKCPGYLSLLTTLCIRNHEYARGRLAL